MGKLATSIALALVLAGCAGAPSHRAQPSPDYRDPRIVIDTLSRDATEDLAAQRQARIDAASRRGGTHPVDAPAGNPSALPPGFILDEDDGSWWRNAPLAEDRPAPAREAPGPSRSSSVSVDVRSEEVPERPRRRGRRGR